MKKIKYLSIQFNNELSIAEMPWFRGAVIAAAGRENGLFHNHDEQGAGGYRYAYPLIQYKRVRNRAAIICLEEGVNEIHAFFQGRPRELMIGNRPIVPEVEHLHLNEVTLQAWDTMFSYRLSNWLALKPEHYREFQEKTDEADRDRFLTAILRGNILSMAKGLGWFVDREVKVNLLHRSPMRLARYKDTKLSAFDVRFESNVWLPKFVGLGKGGALGFGVCEGVSKRHAK